MFEVFINNKSMGEIIDVSINDRYVYPDEILFWEEVDSILTNKFIIDFIDDKIILGNGNISYILNHEAHLYIIDKEENEIVFDNHIM